MARKPKKKIHPVTQYALDVVEGKILANTKEVYPGLIVAGMSANAVMGTHRMGPIFGGMLLSGRKAAEIAAKLAKKQ